MRRVPVRCTAARASLVVGRAFNVVTAVAIFACASVFQAIDGFAVAPRLRRPPRLPSQSRTDFPSRLVQLAVPLSQAEGGVELPVGLEQILTDFDIMLPEEEDIESLAFLLVDSFNKLYEPYLLPPSFGPVADLWKQAYMWLNRDIAKFGMRENLSKRLKQPSIALPIGLQIEGHSMGVMLVPKSASTPVAFFEMFLLPPDGRQPDDPMVQILPLILGDGPKSTWQPYLANLCVSPGYRRRGLGRATMELAEYIAQKAWGKEWLYLHADNDAAPVSFYKSCKYQKGETMAPDDTSEVVYMRKQLQTVILETPAPADS